MTYLLKNWQTLMPLQIRTSLVENYIKPRLLREINDNWQVANINDDD